MNLETITKINKVIDTAKQIALILPENVNIDKLCAAISLQNYLKQQGKTSQIFTSSKDLPKLDFLANQPKVFTNFGNSGEFTIRIRGNNAKPKQLRYEKDSDDLLIFITPESGKLTEQDVELLPASQDFDLFIMLGVTTLEDLGALHQGSPELFYQTTKIAISNNIEQEYYAAITWVEPTSASLTEQIGTWLEHDQRIDNETMATSLLAGIIEQTQSFRDPKTTPNTLELASKLVKHGAKQQEIIQYLFKTKPFPLLQLWGRAMARVKVTNDNTVLYSTITKQDFEKTQTDLQILPSVLKELVEMANSYQLVVLVAELAAGVKVMMAAPPHVKLKALARLFNEDIQTEPEMLVGNHNFIDFTLSNFSIDDSEKIVSTMSGSI
jgi:nanoRNase/pAp phosphatase (c-di-AMP/oligoRNAs hydrolase)